MKTQLEKTLARYDYDFPEKLIAQKPASPREKAKLLVYDRKTREVAFANFWQLEKFLKPKTILVFNQTKVVPARIEVRKSTGGRVRLLYLEQKGNFLKFLADRKLDSGSELWLGSKKIFQVKSRDKSEYIIKPHFPPSQIYQFLEKYGQTPIPPYIKKSPLSEKKLREEYQTVFAKNKGSAAAPTASLHFSKKLISKLKKSGVLIKFITLHVGLGTFASVTEENLKLGKLHKEHYVIDSKTLKLLNSAKKSGYSVVAVGTTSLRALESSANSEGVLKKAFGETDLFIQKKYKFRFINGLITNFHVPKSSLLMLVSALIGRQEVLRLYNQAIKRKFRLFSFGDGMLIK